METTAHTKAYPATYLDSRLIRAREEQSSHRLFRDAGIVPHSELAWHVGLAGKTIDRLLVFYSENGYGRYAIVTTTDGKCTDGLLSEVVRDHRSYEHIDSGAVAIDEEPQFIEL